MLGGLPALMILINLNLPTCHFAGNSLTSHAAHESNCHLTFTILHRPAYLNRFKKKKNQNNCRKLLVISQTPYVLLFLCPHMYCVSTQLRCKWLLEPGDKWRCIQPTLFPCQEPLFPLDWLFITQHEPLTTRQWEMEAAN